MVAARHERLRDVAFANPAAKVQLLDSLRKASPTLLADTVAEMNPRQVLATIVFHNDARDKIFADSRMANKGFQGLAFSTQLATDFDKLTAKQMVGSMANAGLLTIVLGNNAARSSLFAALQGLAAQELTPAAKKLGNQHLLAFILSSNAARNAVLDNAALRSDGQAALATSGQLGADFATLTTAQELAIVGNQTLEDAVLHDNQARQTFSVALGTLTEAKLTETCNAMQTANFLTYFRALPETDVRRDWLGGLYAFHDDS